MSISKIAGSLIIFNVLLWTVVIGGTYFVAKEIKDVGLKNIIERIWEGPNDSQTSLQR